MLPSVALRLPAILGKGARRHWLANIILSAQQNKEIHIFNPHAPYNNAIHIQDLCEFIDALLQQSFSGFNPLNLAAKNYISIEKIIEKVKYSFDSSSNVIIDPTQRHSFTISTEKEKNE